MAATCRHDDCTGEITQTTDAADLPDGLTFRTCDDCGTSYEYDATVGDLRINL
jgi:NMD protein affecting ribosome stability and mRNA decay